MQISLISDEVNRMSKNKFNPYNINKTLKLLRIYNFYRNGDMAELLKVSPSYVTLLEKSTRKIGLSLLSKFAVILNMSVSQLVRIHEKLCDTDMNTDIPVEELIANGFFNVLTNIITDVSNEFGEPIIRREMPVMYGIK